MKYFFVLCIVVAFLFSCDSGIIEEDVTDVSCTTRSIVGENGVSISNPELINNWENLSEIVLNTLGTDIKSRKVDTPWSFNGSSSALPETFRKDIKKENGWKMLFHTFKEVGLAEKQNYMCFYNIFTGFVKIFYYYEGNHKSQGTQWFIMTSEGQKVSLLEKPSYLSKADSDVEMNDILLFSNMVKGPTYGLITGWNGFEFQVSRYGKDLTNMDFIIGAYDRQITNYNLLGKSELTTVGTITTTSKGSSNISNALANITGPEAEKFIEKLGGKVFGDKVILGKKITNLINSIPTSGYVSAIKGGLDMIFGKTTTSTTSDVKLTTTGTVEISGTSSTEVTAGIPPLSFNLHGILNPMAHQSNSILVTASTPGSGHYLGVWTIKEKPVVYYNRVTRFTNVSYIGMDMTGRRVIRGNTNFPTIQYYKLEPEINPDLIPYITKSSFSVKYMLCNRLQGKEYKPDSQDFHFAYSTNILYSDDEQRFFEIDNNAQRAFEVNVIYDASVKQNYFYDWGNVKDGKVLAIVSLDMTCLYEGKQTEISQSRVYEVAYGIDTKILPEHIHHPPYNTIVNYGYPYMRMSYGWD